MRPSLRCLAVTIAVSCSAPSDWVWERAAPALPREDVVLARDSDTFEARVPRNATIEMLLRQQAISTEIALAVVSAVRVVFNPRALRADQPYRVTRTLDGLLREFQYQIDPDRLLRVVSHARSDARPSAFDATVVVIPKDVAIDAVSAEITAERSSLVAALAARGQNVQLALVLAEMFGGEVDFNSELQRGDRVELLFERMTRQGEFIGYGNVEAAVLTTGGRALTAVRFVGPDGVAGWYDEQGRSLKRRFLRSPLRFEPDPRVTSRFSYRRLHPVDGGYRAHLGVDYGAPAGAPVVAVAAGTVQSAGSSGAAGQMVQIKHPGGYETYYLHLSSFAAGIRAGARVDQGQLIGRVGSTGTATGPHLDYRIKKNGVYVNPLAELRRMPSGVSVTASMRDDFARERDRLLAALRERVVSTPDR